MQTYVCVKGPCGLTGFDRIVRDEKEFREKANYILTNAARAGLVEDGWLYDGFWCEAMQGIPSAG